jgi:OmcA/MtrC family decaheme c-type cytochrome
MNIQRSPEMKRAFIALAVATLFAFIGGCADDGSTGPPGPAGPPAGDPVTAVEACLGCHGEYGSTPVFDITDPSDAHYIDLALGFGPPSGAGYRKLFPTLTTVDVSGTSVVINFSVEDESGNSVTDLLNSDGRFTIARLNPSGGVEPDVWRSLMERTVSPAAGSPMDGIGPDETQATYESFGSSGFSNLGSGDYRYTSNFDPTGLVTSGDTLRVAIQLSAGDLPAGWNGWCDFEYTAGVSTCGTPAITRDIVETDTCNICHGATDDTQLGIHGGGRTDVEYCVTCHNPYSVDPDTGNSVDMPVMIHKIHRGADLNVLPYQIWGYRNSVHDYSEVQFTKDIDNCTNCHMGGGNEVDNWFEVPSAEACGSCHDNVDFATGANHAGGSADNSECLDCHWPGDPDYGADEVHRGVQRATEAARYEFAIDDIQINGDTLEIDYMVTLDGSPVDLELSPEWSQSRSRVGILVGWNTFDYTNVDSGATPAEPLSLDGLDIGGEASDLGGNLYQVVADLDGTGASGTVTVAMNGRAVFDLDGDGTYDDTAPVRNDYWGINVDGGRADPFGDAVDRRDVVDVDRCNACHDASGLGISLHGNNRTGEIQVCVLCHNPDATDINVRPAAPELGVDGKAEESIDMKRMIHQIHSGAELANGVVIYGYRGSVHDYSNTQFIGNRMNCEGCHDAGTYGTAEAANTLPSTIDTGADVADPDDDLNISPIAAVCSSCHDDSGATDHMKLHGASFQALDADIL